MLASLLNAWSGKSRLAYRDGIDKSTWRKRGMTPVFEPGATIVLGNAIR
jgi:hypothetical protein